MPSDQRFCASRPVSRVLYGFRPRTETWQPFLWDAPCDAPQATYPDDWPGTGRLAPRHPYSVLLPVGFTVPSPLPETRWALTPPFHPYPAASMPLTRHSGGGAVCFLWHFPWGRPRRTLSGTVVPWSPDFPRTAAFRRVAVRGCPADWQGRLSGDHCRALQQNGMRLRRSGV